MTSFNPPKEYDNVSVLFADFKGYTQLYTSLSDAEVVMLLDSFYRQVDALTLRFDVEKIKTNGDQYIATSKMESAFFLPQFHPNRGASNLCLFAFAIIEVTNRLAIEYKCDIAIRIGIASGPIIGGMIGLHKPSFDIWGKTVNMAARLEQYSRANRISVCTLTARMLKHQQSGFEPGPEILLSNQYKAYELRKTHQNFV